MKVIKKIDGMMKISKELKNQGNKVGFVPTMGYLHKGHLSLIEKSRDECSKVIVSIFVNPRQFGPQEDFDKYPRDKKRDLGLSRKAGVDYVFNPDTKEMYRDDFETTVSAGSLKKIMCGRFRPLHFDGVCTVVLKLLNIVAPHNTYFGRKDYQQLIIIRKMVRDLNIPVNIVGCPIVREKDGLAVSSRNKYLSPAEREDATILFRCLNTAAKLIKNGQLDINKIKGQVDFMFNKNKSVKRVEYFDLREPESLQEINDLEQYTGRQHNRGILIATAVWIGGTRLIDNIVLKPGINIS